jgi:hypothetical protein
VFGYQARDEAEHRGALRVTGERQVAERFLGCFTRPVTTGDAGTAPAAG